MNINIKKYLLGPNDGKNRHSDPVGVFGVVVA